jgi:hypothetical protein
MLKKAFLFALLISLLNIQSFAKSKYDTVVLKPSDNIFSVLKSSNKRYVIGYDYDLKGKEISIGNNSILVFEGGNLSNGKLKGNHTFIEAGLEFIFSNIENTGTFQCLAVYPQWFGAKADGKHDCSEALQQAIDFAVNNYKVGNPWDIQQVEGNCLKVEMPAGSYILKKPIYMRDYTHLEGQGRGITKIVNGGIDDGSALIYLGNNDNDVRTKVNNAKICNLSVNGNDKRCIGIYSLAQYSYIENVFVTKCINYGIYSYEYWCTYINNCHFIYNAIDSEGYTLYLTGRSSGWGANAVTISECEFIGQEIYDDIKDNNRVFKGNCIFTENGNGIRIINSTFQQFNNCIALNTTGTGITVENCYFEAVNTPIRGSLYGINIVHNFFTAPIYSNVIIKSSRMQGCHISNNIVTAGLPDCVIVEQDSEKDDLLYYGNTFTGNFRSGSELEFSKIVHNYLKKTKSNQVITNSGSVYGVGAK